jgi:hypothetical protein
MKRLLGLALMSALFVTPLFAFPLFGSRTTTINIPEKVTVASTQITAGEYKLSYEGSGPAVKVTLTRSGSSPIVLDAKLVRGKKDNVSVTLGTSDGVRILQQIDLKSGTLIFETGRRQISNGLDWLLR